LRWIIYAYFILLSLADFHPHPLRQRLSSHFFGKMRNVAKSRTPHNLDRIGVLSATILLAYTFAGLISLPGREITTQLPGIYLEFEINVQTIVSFLVACLAASGTDWLLREHPSGHYQPLGPHLLLPALTAWAIGVPLHQDALGLYWWVGIFLGGGALILVLMAEFTVVDPSDTNYPIASIGLSIVAYALFFLLAVTLKATQIRLFLIVPALSLVILFVNLRILHLRLRGKWAYRDAGISTLIMGQITIAAYYLPLSPIAFGFFLLGPAYGLTSYFGNLGDGKTWKRAIAEPLIVSTIFWFLAYWLR
jgi:hypothetical protein